MAIDSAIENLNAVRLREEKNKAGQERTEQLEKQTGSLRQALAGARNQQAKARIERMKAGAMNKVGEKVFSPAKKVTGTLLKMAWNALIPSYGLSIIYIDFHVFLRWVIGDKLFCKLGEEWLPESVGELGGAKGMAGIVETMVLILVNVIYLGIIGMVIMSIVWLADNIFLKTIFKGAEVWGWITM